MWRSTLVGLLLVLCLGVTAQRSGTNTANEKQQIESVTFLNGNKAEVSYLDENGLIQLRTLQGSVVKELKELLAKEQ